MKSILEEFAMGNISPEPRYFRKGTHYARTMEILSDCETKLCAALNDELKKLSNNFQTRRPKSAFYQALRN